MVDKYLKIDSNGNFAEQSATVTSTGASNAGNVVALDTGGKLDNSVLPTGVGAETKAALASESLSAGAFVNLYNNSGTINARNADASASSAGKIATGFVLSAVSSGQTATVYLAGINNVLTGLTPGANYFLSGSTPGAGTSTAPSTTGYALQLIGQATSATELAFVPHAPVIRA